MASRTFYPSQGYGSGRVYCEFQFPAPGAATSVAASAIDGADAVASIAHGAGTNFCTVTLKDQFNKVIAHSVDLRDDGQTGNYCSAGNFANENSSSLITFRVGYFLANGSAANNSTAVTVVTLALRNGNWGVK